MTKDLLIDYFMLEKTEQAEIIQACALTMKVDPIIIEKDLWVVLALRALFDEAQSYNAHKGPSATFLRFSLVAYCTHNYLLS